MAQSNSIAGTMKTSFHIPEIATGAILMIVAFIIIIGGIKSIGRVASKLIPFMGVSYLLVCLGILAMNASGIPSAFGQIFGGAFGTTAAIGGFTGAVITQVISQGVARGLFSNEAGQGSAPIAHAAAKTKDPVQQATIAMLGTFIDTIVICTMTALVITITGVYSDAEFALLRESKDGAALTAEAFRTSVSWFPIILSLSVVLFAYSTMISWSYYGERCWTYVFGEKFTLFYKIMFIAFIVIGSITSASTILDFSDLLLLSMALPNFIGLYLLHGKVKTALTEYRAKLKSGELDREVQS
jgi:AGCS family alanine or glycine:cation symporter